VPGLSVIVPATDRPPTLGRCLDRIRSALREQDELIVVEEPRSAGPAEARNDGAAQARNDVLVFVDADVELHADALDRIRRTLAERPELGGVFGSYDDDASGQGVVSAFRNLLHHHVHQQGAGAASTFWAGLGALRRDPFVAAGGFDASRYPRSSIEDVELGMRIARAGGTLVLDPELQGRHLKRWRLRDMVRTDFARRGIPWVALLLRDRSASSVLNLGWRHRLSAAASVTAATALALRRPRPAAGAVLALVCLNRSLYRLVARRRGPGTAAVAVGLHALHHVTAAAAVPAGVLLHVRDRLRGARRPRREDARA
jgi:glycosyltransferase involved in cell wall biosynthesis